MGTWDTILILGAGGVAVWYVATHPEIIQGLFPVPEPQPEPEPNGDGNGGGGGDGNGGGNGGGGDSGYDCAKACRNCWCKSYSENCSKGCSKCCGGSRIASKCGGKGVKTCGGGGGGGSGGGGGGGDGFALYSRAYFSDAVGLGPARISSYEDLFYPHNQRAMRVTVA